MKVLFDHQAFSGAKYGGVARYFYDLMHSLKYSQKVDIELAITFSNNDYLKKSDIRKVFTFSDFLGHRLTNMLFSQINRAMSISKVFQKKYDIFHPTGFNDYFLPYLDNKPFIITYHDVIPEKFPEKYAGLDGFSKAQKQNILNNASKIIAVSEKTKQDLLEIFDISAEKIEVIYHSTHFTSYKPAIDFDINTPKKYLLYIGNRDNYKNFDGFVGAIAPLLKKDKDLYLVCGGNGNFNEFEQNLFTQLEITDKVIHHEIANDDVLYRLYQKSIGFVYPSMYEGFGIPILEAFACGCPVILSDRSCFPEVAQNAALYFNPENKEDIYQKVEKLLNNAELREDLINKGYIRLKDFSSEITAKKTLEVYKKAIGC